MGANLPLLMHDMLVTLYVVVWDTPCHGGRQLSGYFTASFLTIDSGLSLVTGCDYRGELVMRRT